ncbi:hypothetical protein V1227_17090 [Lentzea sp. DG1S-22]|uniref:hypothetical protein n=1 Tax=Lentzea sp. DG1S-22 TaxID=3108822 RepID=UPI002E78824D|nr:hypothetical protein [Lentzea sp. DG1S-22]WVH84386.1 hypothetical protein V1227_17090 [Lentzea sp. DG1S-22]
MTTPDNESGARVYDFSAHHPTPAALPLSHGAVESDEAVQGQVLTPEESAEVDRRLAAQAAAKAAAAALAKTDADDDMVTARDRAQAVRDVLVRNAGYAWEGAKIRRAERRNRRKHLDLEQAITTLRVNAKGAEDFAVLRELEDSLERRRAGVAQRGKERRIEILKWSGGVVVLLAGGHVVLLGIAAVQAIVGAGSLTDRWHGMVEFWTTVADLSPVGGYWWAWAVTGAGTWAVRSISAGRAAGTLPMWAVSAEPIPADARELVPDESAVLNALRHLGGLPQLRDAFKKGWGTTIAPTWIDPPYEEGKGYRMRLVLPRGVPVADIVRKKTVLAHNLVRQPIEVWPTEPKDQPGVLDLWVANQGALSGPVPDWPLLHEGTVDYFKGVPIGVNIRGDVVTARLFECNYALAGVMGSGKSTFILDLVAGAILDPLVDVDVFVMAENVDYEPFAPALRTLRTGSGPETVKDCVDALKALYAEIDVRGKALKEHGVSRNVTRALAAKDARLRPRLMVMDECQALFMDDEHGETAVKTAVKLISAARKYAITLVFATPEPSTESLPRRIMAVTSCKACYAIGDQQSNDAVLGTGSYKAGISAVSLEPKTAEGPGDVGTAMVRGIMAKPGLLRTFYLRKDDEVDQVTPIVNRALELRSGQPTPAVDDDQEQAAEPDLLTDLLTVMGTDKHIRTMVALSRLAELNPGHYGDWTSKTLRPQLDDVDVPIRKSDGHSVIRAEDLTEAITLREQLADAEDDGFADDDA